MSGLLKVASFTVQANAEQSARWKQAAEAAGHRSVGTWLAEAADVYLKARARAGLPVPLVWRIGGRFKVVLETGEEVEKVGKVSPPFGIFPGNGAGKRAYEGGKAYTLVYLPDRRIIATLGYASQARALAGELVGPLIRGMPPVEPGGIIERHRREAQ